MHTLRWILAHSLTGCPGTKCFGFVVASGNLIFLAGVVKKESLYFKIALQIKLCTICLVRVKWLSQASV